MSEPGAGSDVAAIGTKAVKKGDEVNKCFLLAFTIYVVFFYLRFNVWNIQHVHQQQYSGYNVKDRLNSVAVLLIVYI